MKHKFDCHIAELEHLKKDVLESIMEKQDNYSYLSLLELEVLVGLITKLGRKIASMQGGFKPESTLKLTQVEVEVLARSLKKFGQPAERLVGEIRRYTRSIDALPTDTNQTLLR